MNRIILIGNGFDLALGLKTEYKDFLIYLWNKERKLLIQQENWNRQTLADYLLGISDDLPFKMGGLTDDQVQSVLQFVALIARANAVIDKE